MQIVSYGAQDEYLTGEPDVTFFKMAYRKHANFAMESMEQNVNINGNLVTCDINKDGDLITNCWIECENEDYDLTTGYKVQDPKWELNGSLNSNFQYKMNHRNGLQMIEKVDLLIGGQVIDTHYGEWYDIWSQLSLHRKNIDGYNDLINKDQSSIRKKSFIPLQFFFCKNHGLALPMVALKYHEVSLHITFKDNVINPKVFVDYVYLEQEERIRFAQMEHTMLIEQVQYSGTPNLDDRVKPIVKYLNFAHPVKELIWKYTDDTYGSKEAGNIPIGSEITIKLNEYDKITNREDMYFTHIQPFQHHTNIPTGSGIYTYSFALKPEDYQPSGTCNFSRLKTAQIRSKTGIGIEVYAINYNILKITSGMAGLVFSK